MRILSNGIAIIETDTHISRWVQETGRLDHDQYALPIVLQYIQKGDTVVDAGAFIGDHTTAYLAGVGLEGEVWAFEPNPEAFECLKHNCPTAKCRNIGLSDTAGVVGLVKDVNGGASHLSSVGEGKIKTMMLDSLNLSRLDFFKLDVEGYECLALRGAINTITKHRPVMWIEVNKGALERAGASVEMLEGILFDLGYQWSGYPENFGAQYDILCIPQ